MQKDNEDKRLGKLKDSLRKDAMKEWSASIRRKTKIGSRRVKQMRE